MKKVTFFLFITLCINCYARVDYKCLISYSYNKSVGLGYTRASSEPMEITVSFISGAEFKERKSPTERYAIVWFSQTNCAIIKLDAKRNTYVEKLTLKDLYDVLTAGGVYGEQINGGELDDMDMKYRWYITLRDPKRNYDFVDPKLRRYNERTDYSLYAL